MFAWIPFTAAAKRKAEQKAAEKELLQKRELVRIALPPRYNMLTESSRVQRQEPPAVRRDDSADLLNQLNPFSPLSPIHQQSYSAPAESSSHCECHSSNSSSYDSGSSHSSSHSSCSSSSYDSGSPSSYDSGSSSSSSYD